MSTTESLEGRSTGVDVTAAKSPPPKSTRLGGDRWVRIAATWETYLRLEEERGDRSNPKLIYSNERLTIVTLGMPHEFLKLRISWLIETMLVELGIPFVGSGAVTLKQGGSKRKGVEGDTSYYLTNLERISGANPVVMGVDPPPDLQVEVVISHPVRDALRAHAAFGVREVWVCKDSAVRFLALGGDGKYHVSPASPGLPFLSSEDFTPWVSAEDFPDEITMRRAFRAWVLETLAHRVPGRGEQA